MVPTQRSDKKYPMLIKRLQDKHGSLLKEKVVTPSHFKTTKEELEEMIGTAVAFVMRLGD